MQGSAIEGDMAPSVRIFWVPLTSGAQSSFVSCIVSLRFRVLPRYTRTWTSIGIRVGNSGQLNRLDPSGLNGLGWVILSLMLGPGRVDPMGLVFSLTLTKLTWWMFPIIAISIQNSFFSWTPKLLIFFTATMLLFERSSTFVYNTKASTPNLGL